MITSLAEVFSSVQDSSRNDREAVAVLTVLLGAGRITTVRKRRRLRRPAI